MIGPEHAPHMDFQKPHKSEKMPLSVCDGSRLRVLHVGKFYPPHRGGMETHLRDLAIRQAREASVNVVVANETYETVSDQIEQVSVSRLARLTTLASMPVCPALVAAIRRCPADVVHIHMPNPGAAAAFLAIEHSGKLVIRWSRITLEFPGGLP